MFRRASRLKKLEQNLAKLFRGKPGPEVRLLPEDQMLISRGMRPNPAREGGKKATSYVPGEEGYRIYLACRSSRDYADVTGTSQRISPRAALHPVEWDASSMAVQVDRQSLEGNWQILNRDDQVVSISVDCGSAAVLEEVNLILNEVVATLLNDS